MDDSERHDQSDWRGRQRAAVVERRSPWPQFDTSEPTSWMLNLALLVVLCVVVMAIATAVLRQWRASQTDGVTTTAIASATTPLSAPPVNGERSAARLDFVAAQELEKEARAKAQAIADERRAAAIRAREAEEQAAAQASALSARWEREWQAYYRKPPQCEGTRPDIDSVGCANDYIRARRAFDEQFSASLRRR